MGVLIAGYLAAIESRAVTIYVQCQSLTSSLSARILDADALGIEVRRKDSQRRIVSHILAIAYVILAVGSCNNGLVHTLTYQRNPLGRGLCTLAHLYHSLIGSSLHHNSSLLSLSHCINSSLDGSIVTTAILTDNKRLLCPGAQSHPYG